MGGSLRLRMAAGSGIKYGIVIIAACIAMIPILAIFLVSLKTRNEVAAGGLRTRPDVASVSPWPPRRRRPPSSRSPAAPFG